MSLDRNVIGDKRIETNPRTENEEDACDHEDLVKAELVNLVRPFRHKNECHFFKLQIRTSQAWRPPLFISLLSMSAHG